MEYFASLFSANDELQQRVSKELSIDEAQVEKTVEITIEEGWLHRIVNRARVSGRVPEDWTKSLVVPVHK